MAYVSCILTQMLSPECETENQQNPNLANLPPRGVDPLDGANEAPALLTPLAHVGHQEKNSVRPSSCSF